MAGDLATAAIADTNLAEVRVNQGRLREAESLLVPAVRTLVSFEYLIAAALASLHLARTRAFLGDYEAGLAMVQSATRTVDDARVLVGSIEARARLAEVSAHAGDVDRAAQALAEARELERELGETPLTILLDRVEVTLAAIVRDDRRLEARLPEALARARVEGAKYELLLLLELAARVGEGGDERERAELAARARRHSPRHATYLVGCVTPELMLEDDVAETVPGLGDVGDGGAAPARIQYVVDVP